MAMKLNTGKVAFPIEFDNGDKDCIYFNPNDPDLIFRMKQFKDRLAEKTKSLEDVELTNEGKPSNDEQIETFEKLQNILKDELDYVFGGEVSKVVFKHCSPFAFVGGKYYMEHFMDAIRPEIEKHIKKSSLDFQKKANKYIGEYVK
jgi:hypothetical protein